MKEQKRAFLIIMRGLPGSGKSYVAKKLEETLGPQELVILDPDGIDFTSSEYSQFSEELSRQGVDIALHPYRFLRANAYSAIDAGKIILWNQAFTNQELVHRTIINLQAHASEKEKTLNCLIAEMNIDPETAKARVKSRADAGGHAVTNEVFERFLKDYKPLEGYDYPLLSLDGGSLAELSAQVLAEEISRRR